ncbi:hypothetical protein [Streptomyces mayteni]
MAGSAGSGTPGKLGEEALERLLRSNAPGKLSLAGAYAFGYAKLGYSQLEGTSPAWYQEIDPLDALFLGTAWPARFSDELEFANARDAWLRLLRGTVYGKGIQRFVREVVSASEELGMPVDDGQLMLEVTPRLETAGLDQRRLPRRLLPGTALQGCRAVYGPALDLLLPDPPVDATKRVKRFWKEGEDKWLTQETPRAILRDGLRRLHDAGLPVEEAPGVLLPALYAALLTKPGEPLEDLAKHSWAWALSLDERSALVPLLDTLLVAVEREMSVDGIIGLLFADSSFTQPIPSEALLWTSSPGLALPRLAFELGISEVSMLEYPVTPDMLDWAGTQARMRLSASAREDAADLEDTDGTDSTRDESDERWAERREAVREAVLHRVRKKSGSALSEPRPSDRPVERLWNADGSFVVRISTETPEGREFKESLEHQLGFFHEKFGREPGPDDPFLFDPDADDPTPLTRQHFDDMLLKIAEKAVEVGVDPAFIHAWREVGYIVSTENMSMLSIAEVLTYTRAVSRYRQAAE